MAKRGPRNLPRETHKRRGTLRQDRHEGPDLAHGLPAMPADLGPVAQAQWNVIGQQLLDAGLVAEIDGTALRLFCESFALYLEANDEIKQHGLTTISPETGAVYQNPAIGIRNKAWSQIMDCCRQFGMTPSARCGMHLKPKDKPETDIASILGLKVV